MTDYVISEFNLKSLVNEKGKLKREAIAHYQVCSRPLSEELTKAYREGYGDGRDATITELGEIEFVAKKAERERVCKFIEDGANRMIYKSEAGSKIIFLDCLEGMIEELRSKQ